MAHRATSGTTASTPATSAPGLGSPCHVRTGTVWTLRAGVAHLDVRYGVAEDLPFELDRVVLVVRRPDLDVAASIACVKKMRTVMA